MAASQKPDSRGRDAERIEQMTRVVELRRRRLSFGEIGRELGIRQSTAYEYYRRALAMVPVAAVEEHRAEELALVDDAINSLMPIARDHTHPRVAVEAWNSIRGWAERKAKLMGLDAPDRLQVFTIDQIDHEIAKLRLQMAATDAVDSV